MRITMHENEVLNAVMACHPTKSSLAKISTTTGKARNEVEEIVSGLKKIGYVNVTANKEVYLLEGGRKYLGITSNKPESSQKMYRQEKQSLPKEHFDNNDQSTVQLQDSDISVKTLPQHPVLDSVDAIAKKLNKPVIEINDLGLKSDLLTRLASFMSDDVAEVLVHIKDDLERAVA